MTDDHQVSGRRPPDDGPDAPTRADIPVTPGLEPAPPPPTAPTPTPPTAAPAARPSYARPVLLAAVALLLIWLIGLGLLYAMGFFGPTSPETSAVATPTGEPTAAATASAAPTVDLPSPAGPGVTGPATTTPGAAPSATTSSSSSPTVEPDPRQRLLGHVPPHLRSTCTLEDGTAPALAVASCPADEGKILATYFLYADPEAMENAYQGFAAEADIEPNSGRCSDEETWPSESSYSVSGEPAGRVLCMQFSDAPTIYWTDTRLNILTWAFHFDGDAQRLYEFWELEAGPGL